MDYKVGSVAPWAGMAPPTRTARESPSGALQRMELRKRAFRS